MSNDNDFDERLHALEEHLQVLDAEVRRLHRELRVQGLNVPEMSENPAKDPMSPESLLAHRQEKAARAREAKPIGVGKGAVSSVEVKERMIAKAKHRRPWGRPRLPKGGTKRGGTKRGKS